MIETLKAIIGQIIIKTLEETEQNGQEIHREIVIKTEIETIALTVDFSIQEKTNSKTSTLRIFDSVSYMY